jgi:tetraacyldisaccharide 4'-kinase
MRGYGKDESAMLQERLRGVPIVRSPDRFAGLRQLSREGIKTVVLDDAFQRRNLARDVDIVLIDARTFSRKDFFLPLGSLREPLRSARRADIIVITKADAQPSAHEAYEKFLARIGTQKDAVFFSSYTATCGRDVVTGEEISLATLRTQRVAGFCGIANPEYFYDTLKNNTAGIDAFYIFPDHYGYRGKDLAPVLNRARAQALGAVVITAKDAAGLRAHIAPEDLRALASSARIVSLEITMDCSDEEKFFQRIDTLSRT